MSINPQNDGLSPERMDELARKADDSLIEMAGGQAKVDAAMAHARTLPAAEQQAYQRRIDSGDPHTARTALAELQHLAKRAGQ